MTKPIKYKNTGLEWCPLIPEHWEVRKISQGFNIIGSGTTPSAGNVLYYENGAYNWLQTGDLTNNEINTTSRKITKEALDDYSTLRFYQKGSLVIAMYGATIGKVGILNIETTTNQACCVLSNSTIWIIRYIYYWFIANRNHIITLSYGGGQPNISQQTIRDLRVPLPPLMEQQRIADYLDQKTSLIDSIISKKEKQIELYKEERTAVINHAVTKGLNPDVEMKDSGIEWLGSIPKHWEVKRLKYLLKQKKGALKTGPFGTQLKTSDYVTREYGNIKVYTQRNVLDNDFICGDDFITDKKFKELSSFEITDNDLLITTRGTIGKSALFIGNNQRGVLHPCLIRLQIDERKVFIYWIQNYFNNTSYFIDNIKMESNSTIMEVIYGGTLAEIVIPLPPLSEQKEIVSCLNDETNRIDTLISKTSKQIQLLKEYKEALINEVVTGQRIIH